MGASVFISNDAVSFLRTHPFTICTIKLFLKYSIFDQCLYFCIHFIHFCISSLFFLHGHVFACYLNFNYRSRLNLLRFFKSRKNSRLQTINDTFFYFKLLKRYQNFRDFISKILKENKTACFSFDNIDISILLWYFFVFLIQKQR